MAAAELTLTLARLAAALIELHVVVATIMLRCFVMHNLGGGGHIRIDPVASRRQRPSADTRSQCQDQGQRDA